MRDARCRQDLRVSGPWDRRAVEAAGRRLLVLGMAAVLAGCSGASRPSDQQRPLVSATAAIGPTATSPGADLSPTSQPLPTAMPTASALAAGPTAATGATANPVAFRGLGTLAFVAQGRLQVLDGAGGRLVTVPSSDSAAAPAWSPDGQWLAFVRLTNPSADEGQLWVVKGDGSQAHRVLDQATYAQPGWFAWSPVADTLAAVTFQRNPVRYDLWTIPVAGTASRRAMASYLGPLAWSLDGATLAYSETLPAAQPAQRSDALETLPLREGTPTQRFVAPQAGIVLQGWWPDGRGLMFWQEAQHSASLAADGSPLGSLSLATGTPATLATTLPNPLVAAWSPYGRQLLLVRGGDRGGYDHRVLAACTVAPPACQAWPQPAGTTAFTPVWSPTGRQVAFVRAAAHLGVTGSAAETAAWAATRTLWLAAADGSGQRELASAGTNVWQPQWSRDGSRLLYARVGGLWLVDVATGAATPVVAGLGPRTPVSFAWHR